MTISDFISKLGSKAGLNMKDPKYAGLLAVTGDIPDEDANKITGSLLSMDDAKNNLALKDYWLGNVLHPADLEMQRLMDEKGLSIEDKEALQAEKSTYKRIGQLVNKIQKLESEKAGATGADKKDLQNQINQLTSKIGEIQKASDEKIKQINSDWQAKLTNSTIRSILASKEYANEELPKDVQIETAMVLLNKALESSGAKIVNTNSGLALKQAKDDTLDWLNSTNDKPSFEQFIDGLLAEKKMLRTNKAGSNPVNNGGLPRADYTAPPIVNGNGNGANNANQLLVNEIQKDRQALEEAMKF